MTDEEQYEHIYRPLVDALDEIAEIADGTTAGGRYVASHDELRDGLRKVAAVLARVDHFLTPAAAAPEQKVRANERSI